MSRYDDLNITFSLVTAVRASPEPRRAPSILEPPHHVDFTNDTGALLSCATRGDYQVRIVKECCNCLPIRSDKRQENLNHIIRILYMFVLYLHDLQLKAILLSKLNALLEKRPLFFQRNLLSNLYFYMKNVYNSQTHIQNPKQ